VLDFEKILVNKNTDGSPITVDDNLELASFPLETSTLIPVLGLPVQITVALVPEVGLYYSASVENASVVAKVEPYVRAKGKARAGLELGVAELGIGGTMTLVEYSPSLLGRVELEPTADKVDFAMNGYAWSRVKLLEGRIYGYIDFPWWVPFADIEIDIIEEDGITFDSPIFVSY